MHNAKNPRSLRTRCKKVVPLCYPRHAASFHSQHMGAHGVLTELGTTSMPPLSETSNAVFYSMGKHKGPTTIKLTSSVHHRAIWRILFWRFRASLAYLRPICIRLSSPLPFDLVLVLSYPGQSPLSFSSSVPLGLSLAYRHWLASGIDLGTGPLPRTLSSGQPLYLLPRVHTELGAT